MQHIKVISKYTLCRSVAWWLGSRSCDVMGLTPSHDTAALFLRQVTILCQVNYLGILPRSTRFTDVSQIITFLERRFPDSHFLGKTFPGLDFSHMVTFLENAVDVKP